MLSPEAVPPSAADQFGEIYDRGYQHYDGARLGRRHAIGALVLYSMKRGLGIKKGIGAKIIPIVLYVSVFLPAIVGIGVRAFVPDADIIDYSTFFGIIFLIEGIFVATIAPEMLCGDRRENVLPLYFSRVITRADYLLAKLGAASLLTLTVSLVPAVILWLGFQLLEDRPLVAMRDNLGDLGRVAVAGVMIALYLGAIGLVISSFTGRKSIAVSIIVFGFLISEGLATALTVALADDNPLYRFIWCLSPTQTASGLVTGLFDQTSSNEAVGLWLILGVMVAVVLICWVVMYLRYVPND